MSYGLPREVRQESVLVSGSVTGWETLVPQVFEGEVVEGRLRLRDEGVNPAGAEGWREAALSFAEHPVRQDGALEAAGTWWLWGRRAELPGDRVMERARPLDYAPVGWRLTGADRAAFGAVQGLIDSGSIEIDEGRLKQEFAWVGATDGLDLTEFREEAWAGLGVTGYGVDGRVTLSGVLAFDVRDPAEMWVPEVLPEEFEIPVDGAESGRFLAEDERLPWTLSLKLAEAMREKTGKPVVMVGSLLREAALWQAWNGRTVSVGAAWRRMAELGRADEVTEVEGVLVVRPGHWGWHRANWLPSGAVRDLVREWAEGEDLSFGPVVRFVKEAGTIGQGSEYLGRWRREYAGQGRAVGTRQWVDGTLLALMRGTGATDTEWEAAIRNELQGARDGELAVLRRLGRGWQYWRGLEKRFEFRPAVRVRVEPREGQVMALMTEAQWAAVQRENPDFAPFRVRRLEGEEAVMVVRGRVSFEGARVLVRLGG